MNFDLKFFKLSLLGCKLFLCGLDGLDTVRILGDGNQAPQGVSDRLEPVVSVHTEQVGARHQTLWNKEQM